MRTIPLGNDVAVWSLLAVIMPPVAVNPALRGVSLLATMATSDAEGIASASWAPPSEESLGQDAPPLPHESEHPPDPEQFVVPE
jgi:hypothetical protein